MVRTSVFADCVTRLIHGRVHVGSKDKQSRPDSSIQAFNLSRNHAHRETQRDPRLHLPICPHALCDIPHMHYVTFPHMHYVTFPHMHYVTFPHMHYVTSPHMHYVTSPTAFTHFPHALCDIPPHALCDIPDCIYPFPHMHYCVMRHSPTLFLHYICRLCEGTRCNTWRNTARSSILIHILYIFADLRGTRRDTCAAPYTLHYICRPAKGLV